MVSGFLTRPNHFGSIRGAAAFLLLAAAAPAVAQSYDENPSGRSLFVLADLRATVADGEPSWIDGGFGKARFGSDGQTRARLHAVEGDVVWQPQITWSLDGTVALSAQEGQDKPVDVSEAFIRYRHHPIGGLRLSARAGLMWPPVSLEHSGPAWSVTETITPSAINSWIGEEVKPVAAEANASFPLVGGRAYLTAAVFGYNDTSGTLLAFRGWALHDQKATLYSQQQLPPLGAFMLYVQAPRTRPVIELDDRAGVYAKIGWASPKLALSAFYYDNRGDPQAVDSDLQWGWHTRFANVSLRFQPGAHTTIASQVMLGTTEMGFETAGRIWIDTRFSSAFVLATRKLGDRASLSARAEAFGTRGRGSQLGAESGEDGWAATLAGRYTIGDHVTLLGEVQHIDSDRAERARVALSPAQRQTIVQLSTRLTL